MNITNIVNKIMDHPKTGLAPLVFVFTTLGVQGFTEYQTKKQLSENPSPPKMEDVNKDGKKDWIEIKPVRESWGLGGYYKIGEVVFYGKDVDGQRVYLPENLYNDLMREVEKQSKAQAHQPQY